MIEYFSEWISGIICVGILFTLVRLIMPESNLKKYINSLIGLVTILVIFKPVINTFKINELDKIVLNATHAIEDENNNVNITDYSNYEQINQNNLKEIFAKNLEKDIEKKAENASIKEKNSNLEVKVTISNTYNIEKINILYSGKNVEELVHFISTNYDTTKDKISLVKGG